MPGTWKAGPACIQTVKKLEQNMAGFRKKAALMHKIKH
jgi:hypothetical protein